MRILFTTLIIFFYAFALNASHSGGSSGDKPSTANPKTDPTKQLIKIGEIAQKNIDKKKYKKAIKLLKKVVKRDDLGDQEKMLNCLLATAYVSNDEQDKTNPIISQFHCN